MDIFRSKEIYRKIKKREEGEIKDPIVAIRGLYVVGDHMYPVYDNSCVTINEVKTKHPKIVDFTSISADVSSDHITRLIGMNITNTQPTLIRYYRKPLLCQPEPVLMITSVNVNHCTITDGDISY